MKQKDNDFLVEDGSIQENMLEDGEATGNQSIECDPSIFLTQDEELEGFLPEPTNEDADQVIETSGDDISVEGTELDNFDSAEIEETEFVEEERLESIIESVLFASDRPVSLASLKMLFKGTNIRGDKVRKALDQLAIEYAGGRRGVTLEEVPGGYQLRTKIDNMEFLKRTLKTRQFKLSGPALEVLSIIAYKQPVVKAEIDEIRGVESGHLLRALMEKSLVCFEGKSELPGRPMQYGTTKRFLEIFGLRSTKELPTLSQIDELLPEGIDESSSEEKPTLASITDSMSESFIGSYSQGEEDLMKISEQLEEISTSTNFFEEEKKRQAEKRDQERAQNIRDALAFGEPVSNRDQNWLKKYDEALANGTTLVELASQKKAQIFSKDATPMTGELENTISLMNSDDATDSIPEKNQGSDLFENASSDSFLEDNDSGDVNDDLPFLGEADEVDGEGEAHI